jgi:hypothetical protein
MVQVASQSRHRQHVSKLMTLASASMILPPHCGHAVGRATGVMNGVLDIVLPVFSPSYPSSSTLANQRPTTQAIAIAHNSARFCLARLLFAPSAIHRAHR